MEVRRRSLLRGAQEAEGTVVVIDVYRAFTTAAVAFVRQAEKILFVSQVDRALSLRDAGVGHVCVGEVGGRKPDGFDHNNSPFELCRAHLKGMTVIQSTRAGTVGLEAARNADCLYAASLVQARATAQAILQRNPRLVTLVAMGWQGEVRTEEDEGCADYMEGLLQGLQPDRAALRARVLDSPESRKFGDPAQPHFHLRDRDIALTIDSVPFAIPVVRENGYLVARPEPVDVPLGAATPCPPK